MWERRELLFGEHTVSWLTVRDELAPDRVHPDDFEPPHDDDAAREMHRLRGLVMVQASETEAVLGEILVRIEPGADIKRPAGALLSDIRKRLPECGESDFHPQLDLIGQAIARRNDAVHRSVTIGSSWAPHETGSGEWVPVISLMGDEAYDETDLRDDLALQQEATIAAVRILLHLEHPGSTGPDSSGPTPSTNGSAV